MTVIYHLVSWERYRCGKVTTRPRGDRVLEPMPAGWMQVPTGREIVELVTEDGDALRRELYDDVCDGCLTDHDSAAVLLREIESKAGISS